MQGCRELREERRKLAVSGLEDPVVCFSEQSRRLIGYGIELQKDVFSMFQCARICHYTPQCRSIIIIRLTHLEHVHLLQNEGTYCILPLSRFNFLDSTYPIISSSSRSGSYLQPSKSCLLNDRLRADAVSPELYLEMEHSVYFEVRVIRLSSC